MEPLQRRVGMLLWSSKKHVTGTFEKFFWEDVLEYGGDVHLPLAIQLLYSC